MFSVLPGLEVFTPPVYDMNYYSNLGGPAVFLGGAGHQAAGRRPERCRQRPRRRPSPSETAGTGGQHPPVPPPHLPAPRAHPAGHVDGRPRHRVQRRRRADLAADHPRVPPGRSRDNPRRQHRRARGDLSPAYCCASAWWRVRACQRRSKSSAFSVMYSVVTGLLYWAVIPRAVHTCATAFAAGSSLRIRYSAQTL